MASRSTKLNADGPNRTPGRLPGWVGKWAIGVAISVGTLGSVASLKWTRDNVIGLIAVQFLENHPGGGRTPDAPEVIQPKPGLDHDDYGWCRDFRTDDDEADAVFVFIALHRVKGPGDHLLVWIQGLPNPVRWEIVETGHATQVQLHCAAQQAVVGTMTREFPSRDFGTENDIYVRIQVSAYLTGEPILLTAAK